MAAILLATPGPVGRYVARTRSWRAWVPLAVLAVLSVSACGVFSIDPGNAWIFVDPGE